MPRQSPHICILPGGRRVPFSIKSRSREPFYLVCFRSPHGQRLERSTKEASVKRAVDAAESLIRREYEPTTISIFVPWEEALSSLEARMQGNNNRPRTIADYLNTLQVLRQVFPNSLGPSDITPALGKQFKSAYQSRQYSRAKARPPKVWKGRGRKPKPPAQPATFSRNARTIASRLNKLRVIWSKWFIEELGCCTQNPWDDVTLPKLDKLAPRYLTGEEVKAFFDWLTDRWQGWHLPVLFFTVKGFLGNRISELCGLRTEQLQGGRVVFAADATKGRKERKALLPRDVFAQLQEQAGPVWVWERFPGELQERLISLDKPAWKLNPEFSPDRLKWWLQDELADYNAAHPEQRRIKAHDFRRKAMTEAWRLGIPLEKAAIAFGCNPNTMRAHYIALDETEIADEVLTAIAGKLQQVGGSTSANGRSRQGAAPSTSMTR